MLKRTREERTLTAEQMRAIERMTENAREVSGTCGHGYTFPDYPVHLHHSVLTDLERLDTSGVVDDWWSRL